MASKRTPDDDFDGIDIELPFISLRAGRPGRKARVRLSEDNDYDRARRRVRARLGFYRHLAAYGAVVLSLFLIDWLTGDGWWVQWVGGIWGALLIWQAFNVFVFPTVFSAETEERMIEEELRRMRGDVTPPPSE